MNVAIAIFVKTPGLSPLKTRLAATIGREKAVDFYRLSLQSISSTLSKVNVTPYWAVGELEGLDDPLWQEFNKLHTGDGDLGDRQSHVYHDLLKTHDAVLLIGGDSPQLSTKTINKAIKQLEHQDFVIGPADDGGYYLLGGRQKIEAKVWAETPWSHEKTRETLVKKLVSKPYELEVLTDVDTEEDLKKMLSEMPNTLNENQIILKDWITRL